MHPEPKTDTPFASEPTIVLCRDLLFASKITGAAKANGVPIKLVRDANELTGIVGRKLIADLNQADAIEACAAWKRGSERTVVGFVSHVDAPTITRARDAGIDLILPRSQFVATLQDLLLDK